MIITPCTQFGPEGSALLDIVGRYYPDLFETYSWMDDRDEGVVAGVGIKLNEERWMPGLVDQIGIHIAHCRLKGDMFTDIVKIEETMIFVRTSVLL